jgi:hypothetical protein
VGGEADEEGEEEGEEGEVECEEKGCTGGQVEFGEG